MAIVPRGKRRKAVAQSFVNDQGFGLADLDSPNIDMTSTPEQPIPEQPIPGQPIPEQPVQQTPIEESSIADEKSQDISQYVFEKLESFGYPPRRLHEFEDEFVEEELFSGDNRNVTVTIPDRYWGKRQRISQKDMKQMIKEIEEKFKLMFVEATRKNKEINMNFTSQGEGEQEDEETEDDILSEVYGEPGEKKKKKKALTLQEMIKEGHNDLYNDLVKGEQLVIQKSKST